MAAEPLVELVLTPLKSGKKGVLTFQTRADCLDMAEAFMREVRRRGSPAVTAAMGFWAPMFSQDQMKLYRALLRVYAYEQEGAFGFEDEYHEAILERYSPRKRSRVEKESLTTWEEEGPGEKHSHTWKADRFGDGETTGVLLSEEGHGSNHRHAIAKWTVLEGGTPLHLHKLVPREVPKRSSELTVPEFSLLIEGTFRELSGLLGTDFSSKTAITRYWQEWSWWRGRQKIDPVAYKGLADYLERVNYCEACFLHLEGSGDGQLAHIVTHEAGGSNTDPRNRIRLCTKCHLGVMHAKGWGGLCKEHPHIAWKITRGYELAGAKVPPLPRPEDLTAKAAETVKRVFGGEEVGGEKAGGDRAPVPASAEGKKGLEVGAGEKGQVTLFTDGEAGAVEP
jgi:hypothetical protein